jgi:hypothetical protein
MIRMRSLRKSLREEGKFLAAWLGDPESDWGYGPSSQQQAADLVLGLVTLREKVSAGIKRAQAEQEIAAINDMLERYPYVLRLGKVSRNGFHFYEDIRPGGLIDIIFRLARAGVLDRLRRCAQCGKWCFTRGTSCSTPCRQKRYRDKPETKEKTRLTARTYYRDILSPVTAKHLKWRKGKRNAKKR